jgi:hypothetical protein
METDTEEYIIPEDNICLEFSLNDNNYVVVSSSPEVEENDEVVILKKSINEDQVYLDDIEDDNEYEKVKNRFLEILEKLGDEEYD